MVNNDESLIDLPVTVDAFNALYAEILLLTGFEDRPSYKQYIATMIMHMPETQRMVKKSFFVDALHKRLANEAAYTIIQEVRQLELKQKEVTLETSTVTSECSTAS